MVECTAFLNLFHIAHMLTYGLTREAPVRPRKLRFGILSPEEVRSMSVCEVKETTLYYRGLPAVEDC